MQHAVDAEADREPALVRLDVDVAGALLYRLEEERVHEPDDRRPVARLEQVGRLLAEVLRPHRAVAAIARGVRPERAAARKARCDRRPRVAELAAWSRCFVGTHACSRRSAGRRAGAPHTKEVREEGRVS